jgi:hypothetical protein
VQSTYYYGYVKGGYILKKCDSFLLAEEASFSQLLNKAIEALALNSV